MYEYNRVIKGITTYIDTEIIDKIAGWKKWVVGSAIGLAMSNTTNVFNQIKSNEFIKLLGVIDENDKIEYNGCAIDFHERHQRPNSKCGVKRCGILILNSQHTNYGMCR